MARIFVRARCRWSLRAILLFESFPYQGLFSADQGIRQQAGLFYLGGVSQALVFGRNADKIAVVEEPWE